ncbi:hypothetical protein ABKN59_007382 [Abortiporus biennis]
MFEKRVSIEMDRQLDDPSSNLEVPCIRRTCPSGAASGIPRHGSSDYDKTEDSPWNCSRSSLEMLCGIGICPKGLPLNDDLVKKSYETGRNLSELAR